MNFSPLIYTFLSFAVSTLWLMSCQSKTINYEHNICIDGKIDFTTLQAIKVPEQVLLSAYLLVYGNECTSPSEKVKCKILKHLDITAECNPSHIDEIKQWFLHDEYLYYKLQKCPVLPLKSAIQNSIKKIITTRNDDTISITIKVEGMNTSQEKNWNIEQTNKYLIKENSFIKL